MTQPQFYLFAVFEIAANVADCFKLHGLGKAEVECDLDLHGKEHHGKRVELEIVDEVGLLGDGVHVQLRFC